MLFRIRACENKKPCHISNVNLIILTNLSSGKKMQILYLLAINFKPYSF